MLGRFNQSYVPPLSRPIMAVGLRGNTDLGHACAKRLVKKLRARKFSEYYSEWFPDYAYVGRNGLCRLPRWIFHESSEANPNLIILSGVTEVTSDQTEAYYSTLNDIVRFSKAFAVREVYVLDGMISDNGDKQGIRVATTSRRLIQRARRHGAHIFRKTPLPPVSGMLLGLSRLYGLPSMLIVGSTGEATPEDSAVEAVCSFLCRITGLRT